MDQAGQLAGTPLMDPSKNPEALDAVNALVGGQDPQQEPVPPQPE